MPLSAGARLGPYEIVAPLGAGGMGEVYRARDTRLGRDVAVKVMPEAVSSDPDRRSRFEREAHALAALAHPNILAIHDTGLHEGLMFVVTELLEGATLRAELVSGPLPVRKAIDAAIQIARGLAAAHDKGIVHRDLKPDNMFLLADGRLKILDFGLARQAPSATDATETASALTDPGVVMGTIGYMAPEQVRGLAVDARTDLFALGAVLYEMLTGKRAFKGDTAADTMFAIVKEDPPELAATRADLSPALERIVRHCLEKNPAERFQTARDVAFALEAFSGSVSPPAGSAKLDHLAPSGAQRFSWKVLVTVTAATAAIVAGVFLSWARWAAPANAFATEWQGELLRGTAFAYEPRVSPKGDMIAFQAMVNGQTQVAVMTLHSGFLRILTDDRSSGTIFGLCWSPNGEQIYFGRFADRPIGIFSVPVTGGAPRPVLGNAVSPQALDDASLLAVRRNAAGAYEVVRAWPERGGRADPVGALLKNPEAVRMFPDEREAVFFGKPAATPDASNHLYRIDVNSGETKRLAPAITIKSVDWGFPLAATADSALFDLPVGDLHRIVAVPRDGSDRVQTLLSLTTPAYAIDVNVHDGNLFLDQLHQPLEMVEYSRLTRQLDRTPLPDDASQLLPLPDGRTLVAGRTRVMAYKMNGGNPELFVAGGQDTTAPMAMLGTDRVVLMLGAGSTRAVAVVSAIDGRISHTLKHVAANDVQALAGSRDGKTIYYVSATNGVSEILEVPNDPEGRPRQLRSGNAVAVDPKDGSLVIQVTTPDGTTLFRHPAAGGSAHPIPFTSDRFRLSNLQPLGPSAVGRDGRIAVRIAMRDSWFWPAAILDPQTGHLESVPPEFFNFDMDLPAWSHDGRLVARAVVTRSSLWRFRPVTK